MVVKGKYESTAPTITPNAYRELQLDVNGNLKVSDITERVPATAKILAKATGSDGGLGVPSALAASEHVYVRCDCSDKAYRQVDWLVKTSAKTDLAFYRARSIVDSVDITLDAIADTNTIVINGITLTAKANAAAATYASRYFRVDATGDTADAVVLAALINADYAVVTAGTSVAAEDILTITTDEGAHTITAAAAADYEGGKYALNATPATELASIVLAINHKDNVTCATASAGDTVTINNGLASYTFTGHATTTTAANREWAIADDATAGAAIVTCVNDRDTITLASAVANDALTVSDGVTSITYYGKAGVTENTKHRFSIDTSDTAAALELLTLINADFDTITASQVAGVITLIPAYGTRITTATVVGGSRVVCKAGKGVPGITASLSTATVSFARDSQDYSCTVTSSNATRLAVESAGGVPGVLAVATGYAGELSITPTWTKTLTVSKVGDQLTVTEIDIPGILATPGTSKVTLTPGTPAGTEGDLAPFIQVTGTATRTVISKAATLLGLALDYSMGTAGAIVDIADNSTTAGTIFEQSVDGWEYAYLDIFADGTTPTIVVKATPRL